MASSASLVLRIVPLRRNKHEKTMKDVNDEKLLLWKVGEAK
jgi:hypothetical protein